MIALKTVPTLVFLLSAVCLLGSPYANAQGLYGVPADPRFPNGYEVANLADYGFDYATDITHLATVVSVFLAAVLGILRARKRKGRLLVLEFGILSILPISVHFLGVWWLGNYWTTNRNPVMQNASTIFFRCMDKLRANGL